jgi:NAD(P)H-dependent flavin oxidoreductase YrpB (nitropropane dioxygenase family)
VLDALAGHRPATMKLEIEGLPAGEAMSMSLDPAELGVDRSAPVRRPAFLPIVSANSLATTLARKANGTVEGFIVEGPTAGGHNAPPRGEPRFNDRGEPLYGERDNVDMEKLRELGLPFWIAGGSGSPQHLVDALKVGAAGVQVGTLFAFCEESGLEPRLKQEILKHAARGEVEVMTDPRASPTGYPFKVARWSNGSGKPERQRLCDLGYLRVAYKRDDGRIGFRCAAEPVADYVRKGGAIEDTVGRQCLCNALTANIGQPQLRVSGEEEQPLVTSGDDLTTIANFLDGRRSYTAGDVIDYLRSWIVAPRQLAPAG